MRLSSITHKAAITTASLALAAVATMTGLSPASAADSPTGLTHAERSAALALIDADTPAELVKAADNPALPAEAAEQVTEAAELLSADTELYQQPLDTGNALSPEHVRSLLRRVIDPTLYQCEPTELDSYINENLMGPMLDFDVTNATPEEQDAYFQQLFTLLFYNAFGGMNAPTYDVILNANDSRYSRFGTGDINQTSDLTRTFFELKNFWDIDGRPIRFEPLKSFIVDSTKAGDRTRFGKAALASVSPDGIPATDDADAVKVYDAWANVLDTYRKSLPWLDSANPVYTLNAFALDPADEAPIFRKYGKILTFGDGLLQAQQHLGLLDVGPDAVMGHEYGHHVQYVNKAFTNEHTAEATRRTELMADGYAAYFAAHQEGMALNGRRLSQVVTAFEEVGDCGFEDEGHHGTPLQRQRSAIWGAEKAQDAPCNKPNGKSSVEKKNGTCRNGTAIEASKKFQREFDAALPSLVAPDA